MAREAGDLLRASPHAALVMRRRPFVALATVAPLVVGAAVATVVPIRGALAVAAAPVVAAAVPRTGSRAVASVIGVIAGVGGAARIISGSPPFGGEHPQENELEMCTRVPLVLVSMGARHRRTRDWRRGSPRVGVHEGGGTPGIARVHDWWDGCLFRGWKRAPQRWHQDTPAVIAFRFDERARGRAVHQRDAQVVTETMGQDDPFGARHPRRRG